MVGAELVIVFVISCKISVYLFFAVFDRLHRDFDYEI